MIHFGYPPHRSPGNEEETKDEPMADVEEEEQFDASDLDAFDVEDMGSDRTPLQEGNLQNWALASASLGNRA